MEGIHVFDSYQRYKFGQDNFTSWLIETSEKCGYSALEVKSTGKKAKKQKRAAVNFNSSKVPIAELTSRAQKIAQTSADSIPRSIIYVLRDVITQRQKVQKFFVRKGEASYQTNEGHSYIIEVLMSVQRTLESAVKSQKHRDEKPEKSPSSRESSVQDQLSNIFDLLEVEDFEPGAEPLGMTTMKLEPSIKSHKRTKESPKHDLPEVGDMFKAPHSKYELEQTEDEEFFMVYCLFQDFNVIREELQELWCDYQESGLNLAAVAVITNTAFDMFQRMEKSFLASIPKASRMRHYKNISDMILFERGLPHNNLNGLSEDQQKEALFEDVDWICWNVYIEITDFFEHVPQGKIPLDPKPKTFEELSDYGIGWEDKMRPNKAILREILMEACQIKAAKLSHIEIPAEDELTKGMVDMLRARTIPIWMLFALQVYLDIRFVLETGVVRAHQELLSAGARHKKALEEHIAFTKDVYSRPPKLIKLTLEEIDCWITSDFMMEMVRERILDQHRVRKDPKVHDFFYLRRNPILCGLMVFRFSLTMNELGLENANSWGHIMAAMHIYNAIHHEMPETLEWPDMDVLIRVHGREHVFFGAPPTNKMAYGKCFELVEGASIQNFAPNRRPDDHIIMSDQGARMLQPRSVVSQIFHERYCFANCEPVLTLANIEKVLNEEIQMSQDGHGTYGFGESRARHLERLKSFIDVFQRTKMLTQTQLLSVLFIRINDESRELTFDYFSFHERCTNFLRDLYDEFSDKIDRVTGDPLSEIDGELTHVTRFIFGALMRESELHWNVAEKVAVLMEKYTKELYGKFEILKVAMALLEFKKTNGVESEKTILSG